MGMEDERLPTGTWVATRGQERYVGCCWELWDKRDAALPALVHFVVHGSSTIETALQGARRLAHHHIANANSTDNGNFSSLLHIT